MAIPPRRPGRLDRPAAHGSIVGRQDGKYPLPHRRAHVGGYLDSASCPLPPWRKVLNWSGSHMKKAVWSGIIAAVGVLALSTSVSRSRRRADRQRHGERERQGETDHHGGRRRRSPSRMRIPDVSRHGRREPAHHHREGAHDRQRGRDPDRPRRRRPHVDTSNTIAISALKWTSTGTNFATSGTSSAGGGSQSCCRPPDPATNRRPDLHAGQQLGVRDRHVYDDADLHAERPITDNPYACPGPGIPGGTRVSGMSVAASSSSSGFS